MQEGSWEHGPFFLPAVFWGFTCQSDAAGERLLGEARKSGEAEKRLVGEARKSGTAGEKPLEKAAAPQTKVAAAELDHFSLREKSGLGQSSQ